MKKILDACCGSRMFWFDRQNPDVTFGDKRREEHVLCDGRHLRIEPDVLLDFTNLPFSDQSYKLVVFDPPHLHTAGPASWMAAKYGKLQGDWRDELKRGFEECFRVLEPEGILIFKWNETQIKVREILALTPHKPLFGHPTNRSGTTHWFTFMKVAA
jgi:SAM-dependent methyltransferase